MDEKLFEIAQRGTAAQLADLLKAGANIDAQDPRTEFCALHHAVQCNNVEVVKALVAAGAKTSATNIVGMTPMDFARRCEHPECLEVLENAGATAGSVFAQLDAEYGRGFSRLMLKIGIGTGLVVVAIVHFATRKRAAA